MQADSLNTSIDTLVAEPVVAPIMADTVAQVKDSVTENQVVENVVATPVAAPKPASTPVVASPKVETEKVVQIKDAPTAEVKEISSINLFANLKEADSAKLSISPKPIESYLTKSHVSQIIPIEKSGVRVFEKEWVFGISVFAVILIIIVRIFYQKYLSSIIASLINMQLAEKLLRERNVLNRRVNLLLNTCFVLSVSFLIYIAAERFQIDGPANNSFYKFLLINVVVVGILLARLLLTKLTGTIFDSVPVYKEYLHNSMVVYKNLGLYLLPLMVSYFFVHESLAPVIYVIGVILFVGALLMRYIKAIQIIIKHNIFLFYSILYLCTLEILPTLIGIKFVLTLR